MKVIESPMQFTVSARGKPAAVPIQKFIQNNYAHIPLEQIDSFFGFTEVSTLYGGRIFSSTELSRSDVRSLYEMKINVRLPLTNDELAGWIRADFPDYKLEASVIKNIDNLKKVDTAFRIYDTVILPMASNDDEDFLKAIDNKENITLFANAGCAYTCPSKICNHSVSIALSSYAHVKPI